MSNIKTNNKNTNENDTDNLLEMKDLGDFNFDFDKNPLEVEDLFDEDSYETDQDSIGLMSLLPSQLKKETAQIILKLLQTIGEENSWNMITGFEAVINISTDKETQDFLSCIRSSSHLEKFISFSKTLMDVGVDRIQDDCEETISLKDSDRFRKQLFAQAKHIFDPYVDDEDFQMKSKIVSLFCMYVNFLGLRPEEFPNYLANRKRKDVNLEKYLEDVEALDKIVKNALDTKNYDFHFKNKGLAKIAFYGNTGESRRNLFSKVITTDVDLTFDVNVIDPLIKNKINVNHYLPKKGFAILDEDGNDVEFDDEGNPNVEVNGFTRPKYIVMFDGSDQQLKDSDVMLKSCQTPDVVLAFLRKGSLTRICRVKWSAILADKYAALYTECHVYLLDPIALEVLVVPPKFKKNFLGKGNLKVARYQYKTALRISQALDALLSHILPGYLKAIEPLTQEEDFEGPIPHLGEMIRENYLKDYLPKIHARLLKTTTFGKIKREARIQAFTYLFKGMFYLFCKILKAPLIRSMDTHGVNVDDDDNIDDMETFLIDNPNIFKDDEDNFDLFNF